MPTKPSQSTQKPTGPASPDDPPRPEFPPDPIPDILLGGSVNLLIGAPEVGKTSLLASMLVQFRDGRPIFGHRPNPLEKIGLIVADRSWIQSTRRWLVKVGYEDIAAYSLLDDREFNARRLRQKQQRLDILRDAIRKLKLPWGSLLSVDPMSLFLGGNINDYDACACACAEIRQLCRQEGLTIIGPVHSSKQKADKSQRYARLQDRIAGSTALTGFSDTQMYLASPEETGEPYYLFQWTPHHAPAESFKLQMNAQGLFVPYGGGEEAVAADLEVNVADALLPFIEESPKLTPMSALLVHAQALGFGRTSLFRFLEQLAGRGLIVKVGRGQYCRRRMH